jgi:hypothetical protein
VMLSVSGPKIYGTNKFAMLNRNVSYSYSCYVPACLGVPNSK